MREQKKGGRAVGMLRSIFRHKVSTFFWLVGLVLAFVALFQILGLYNSILAQQEDLSGTVYQYEAELSVTLSDKRMAQKLDEILDIPDINVKISGPDLILENGVTVTFVQTILFQNEAERVKTYSGTLPNPNHSEEEHLIAVGRNRSDLVKETNGTPTIIIDNVEFLVTGMIGSSQSNALDGYYVTDYASLNANQRTALCKPILTLRFQSDTRDVAPYVQKAAEQIWAADPSADIQSHFTQQALNGSVYIRESLKQYPFYMYLFCICIFMMISREWIRQKERELAIRKAFGQKNRQLIVYLWKELLILTGMAFLVYGCIGGILSDWMGQVGMSIRLHWSNLVIALFFLLATLLVSSGIPIWRLRKIQPAQLLNEN